MGLAPQNGIIPVLAIGALFVLFLAGMVSAAIEIVRFVWWLV